MLRHFNGIRLLQSLPVSLISNYRALCVQPKAKRGARKVVDHFTKTGQKTDLELFPTDLKRITKKKHPQIYIANEQTGQQIANLISRFYVKTMPFVELSPGPCILSKALLHQLDAQTLVLIETDGEFSDTHQQLQEAHSSKVYLNVLKSSWNYYDSISDSIVKYCERREWNEEIVFQLFMCLQWDYIHHIITDIILQRGLFSHGRAEIFSIMTPIDFMKLTAGPSSSYRLYTHLSCIFQILFEYEKLAEISIANFLPWHGSAPAFGGKIEYDTNSFYLVRMSPKRNLFSVCDREDLPRLRFFIYQCFFKRKGYIIPKLERWIPGIGIDLITANFNQTTSSTRIRTLNENNLSRHLIDKFDVFTECGSLTPIEMCALFQFFRQSSQYKSSSFHQQYNIFYTKSNKTDATRSKNITIKHGDEIKIDTSHAKSSEK